MMIANTSGGYNARVIKEGESSYYGKMRDSLT